MTSPWLPWQHGQWIRVEKPYIYCLKSPSMLFHCSLDFPCLMIFRLSVTSPWSPWHHDQQIRIQKLQSMTVDVILELSSEWRPIHGNIGFIIIQVSSDISFEQFITKFMSILRVIVLIVNKLIITTMMQTRSHHEHQVFKSFFPIYRFCFMTGLTLSGR